MEQNEFLDAAWELEKHYLALEGLAFIFNKIINHKSKAKKEAEKQAAIRKRERCVHYTHYKFAKICAEYAAPLYRNGVYVKDLIIKERFDEDPYGLYTEKEWRK